MWRGLFVGMIAACVGCVSKSPTISHVHIGHAVTAHAATPGKVGFLVYAEGQAERAHALALQLDPGDNLAPWRDTLVALQVQLYGAPLPFAKAVTEASNHVTFAGQSSDATPNVRTGAAAFEQAIQGVLVRTQLLEEYIAEAVGTSSVEEARELTAEIRTLVAANLSGEDANRNGIVGDVLSEYGVAQLRRDLDATIAAERPPYSTVDRWYLFNIIRLPSGDWAFKRRDKPSSAGTY